MKNNKQASVCISCHAEMTPSCEIHMQVIKKHNNKQNAGMHVQREHSKYLVSHSEMLLILNKML